MEDKEAESYKTLLRSMQLEPSTYKDVADDWEAKPDEWYHALIAIEDLPIVLSIPNLKLYAWCRCKLVADDGSEDHYHWHGLVHFTSGKLRSWRRQALRVGIRFASRKNTFKKIKCLDHAVGVLRYLACKDGQKVGRRDGDGLVTHPHTHYARQPITDHHRHERGKVCADVRNEISENVASHLNLSLKPNWDPHNLHNIVTCTCDRGQIGKKKKAEANEKRRAFYKTDAGIAVKKEYKEKARIKRMILTQLAELNVSKKAHLQLETIENLVKQLR